MKILRSLIFIATLLSLLAPGLLLYSSRALGAPAAQEEPATPEPSPSLTEAHLHPPALVETETPAPTETETLPPPPTDAPTLPLPQDPTDTTVPTTAPTDEVFLRPLVVVNAYTASISDITPGKEFTLEVKLVNEGKDTATNVVATFAGEDFSPRETGGVIAVGDLDVGGARRISQPLITSNNLWGKTVASLQLTVNYTDLRGVPYHETFAITFPIAWSRVIGIGATATPTSTPSPTPSLRPQLVITSSSTGDQQLQPGMKFSLQLNLENVGNATASRITMIIGGGTSASGATGTDPAPGGVSGGSSDLANFAPLGSSNVQSIGNLEAGKSMSARQDLIVNVSTNPGAYSLKISFTYIDEHNTRYTDDQVITLLVYSLPLLEINFYRDPGPFFTNQPNMLPIQIINLGRKSALLGNMQVTAPGVEFSNNVILVGMLEAGNYFTMDANAMPNQPGPLELTVIVNFTDDFNQPQAFTQTLTVDVLEGSGMEPGIEGPGEPGAPGFEPSPTTPETFWQKAWRFVRGLLGLDSGLATAAGPGDMPPDYVDGPQPGQPLKGP